MLPYVILGRNIKKKKESDLRGLEDVGMVRLVCRKKVNYCMFESIAN